MKITHICLCGPFSDGWNYQENILSKYHKKLGYEVTMIASQWMWDEKGQLKKMEKTGYTNDDGVFVLRIPLASGNAEETRLKRYIGLYKTLEQEKPDIIFMHGFQFLDAETVKKYVKKHDTKLYIDSHADFSNTATNFISKNILNGILWRIIGKRIEPYAECFYGVMPSRVDFLINMYHLPSDKCKLLLMGADDEKVKAAAHKSTIERTRKKYGISESDFLIVTGGKIDVYKTQTLLLMQAVKEIKNGSVRLIVFGSVDEQLKERFQTLVDGEKTQYIGWISPDDSYPIFSAAQLAVFPGRHSVFWEQVVAQGIPLVCKYWDGTTHINTENNAIFLKQDNVKEIKDTISSLMKEKDYSELKKKANKASTGFLYSTIARESILEK